MRGTRQSLLALSAAALMGTGASVVSTPATPTVSSASANQPGNPMLVGTQAPMAPDDRRQWLRSRRTPSRYRNLRQSTGSHKQNRRRALAGR